MVENHMNLTKTQKKAPKIGAFSNFFHFDKLQGVGLHFLRPPLGS